MWLHSPDPFWEKVNTVVSLYHDPPPGTSCCAMTRRQACKRLNANMPQSVRYPAGLAAMNTNISVMGLNPSIAAFDIQTGEVTARCGSRRRADDLLEFMEDVAERYAGYERIIIIWDNLNIHHDGPDKRWTYFNEWHGGKFTFVYTPSHASWVNQIEDLFLDLASSVPEARQFHLSGGPA